MRLVRESYNHNANRTNILTCMLITNSAVMFKKMEDGYISVVPSTYEEYRVKANLSYRSNHQKVVSMVTLSESIYGEVLKVLITHEDIETALVIFMPDTRELEIVQHPTPRYMSVINADDGAVLANYGLYPLTAIPEEALSFDDSKLHDLVDDYDLLIEVFEANIALVNETIEVGIGMGGYIPDVYAYKIMEVMNVLTGARGFPVPLLDYFDGFLKLYDKKKEFSPISIKIDARDNLDLCQALLPNGEAKFYHRSADKEGTINAHTAHIIMASRVKNYDEYRKDFIKDIDWGGVR